MIARLGCSESHGCGVRWERKKALFVFLTTKHVAFIDGSGNGLDHVICGGVGVTVFFFCIGRSMLGSFSLFLGCPLLRQTLFTLCVSFSPSLWERERKKEERENGANMA